MARFLPLGQTLDDLAKTTQTQVDRLQLEQVLLPHYVLLADLFTTSQVTQIQFTSKQHSL